MWKNHKHECNATLDGVLRKRKKRVPAKGYNRGCMKDVEAAWAYDEAAKAMYDRDAVLNFPDYCVQNARLTNGSLRRTTSLEWSESSVEDAIIEPDLQKDEKKLNADEDSKAHHECPNSIDDIRGFNCSTTIDSMPILEPYVKVETPSENEVMQHSSYVKVETSSENEVKQHGLKRLDDTNEGSNSLCILHQQKTEVKSNDNMFHKDVLRPNEKYDFVDQVLLPCPAIMPQDYDCSANTLREQP
ncbi:hypothetical protein KY285_035535 [Solanum tuberosum]|nr:hypothetical protein KY285_035535 [Solanum tuberosum]